MKLDKLFKVITSCETIDQLEVANRYAQLWVDRWGEKYPGVVTDEMLEHITGIIFSIKSKILGE